MKDLLRLILILVAFNTNVFCQVETVETWKRYENTRIELKKIIGAWYATDSIEYAINFISINETIVYIDGIESGVGGPYSFRLDQNGVFVNGSAANWPPYYCTLFLRENNLLEIKYWNFLGPESTSILYKRMKSD